MVDRQIQINSGSAPQQISVSPNFGKINLPARIYITGPSMSGKSKLVLDMLQHRNEVFRGSFSRAIYCGPSAHDFEFTSLLVQAVPSIERHDRVVRPQNLDLYAEKFSQKLLILDDFGNDAMERKGTNLKTNLARR
ncbi:uncharacterized protein LOC131891625 [Tigriopus californicus]|uniref:uncharacterized protein LOC131891625 n=1 Tax=Tigriopus californicus TaxID=6832 RepID=UPI0027DA6642|nr:uncharacterized protein LOC131891625 [Tigriopus californicus]